MQGPLGRPLPLREPRLLTVVVWGKLWAYYQDYTLREEALWDVSLGVTHSIAQKCE